MEPNFHNNEYILTDKISYRFKDPERGSVVVFKYPQDPRKSFIKRIIGLPLETVSILDGKVTIKNTEFPDGFSLEEPYVKFGQTTTADYILGENEYFVMGDNRANSADSRVWGPLPTDNIIGRPFIRFFPPALFPGDKTEKKHADS